MRAGGKKVLVIGDRVLISPVSEERTRVGLYLPATAVEKMQVHGGNIVEVGPGTPVPNPNDLADEPWKVDEKRTHYVALEAEIGDFALFLKSAAVEVEFEGEKYLIVPHAAILLLIRDDDGSDDDRVDAEAAEDAEFRPEDFKL